ncbi:hypothetical protein TEA_025805 [Camellia sinensis var. sinensis]|uniref:t-SNARE coiled-coil homology domain-containing protein n=1 Tax=Camellia sinensis var. sinensis TaxID=542762 RepID=A0A4S4E4J7_CAMSN|nr:hypothetical protein TEA_025805 [Camellia sinensis var. sinensis]
MSVIEILFRVDEICKRYDKYDADKQRELNASGDDAFARLYSAVESQMEAAICKSEAVAMETNRAKAVAMNAEVRRAKARMIEEIPKLQKLALKKAAAVLSKVVHTLPPLSFVGCVNVLSSHFLTRVHVNTAKQQWPNRQTLSSMVPTLNVLIPSKPRSVTPSGLTARPSPLGLFALIPVEVPPFAHYSHNLLMPARSRIAASFYLSPVHGNGPNLAETGPSPRRVLDSAHKLPRPNIRDYALVQLCGPRSVGDSHEFYPQLPPKWHEIGLLCIILSLPPVKGLSKEELSVRSDLVIALPERIKSIPDGSTFAGKQTGDWGASGSNKKITFDNDGLFGDEFFQQSEESGQFREEYEMRKQKQASGLDVISEGLDTLKNLAHDMNEELDRQVPLIDEIDTKVDRTTADLKNTNVRLKQTVNQMRSSRNFCIDIILLCVILGIASYLYKRGSWHWIVWAVEKRGVVAFGGIVECSRMGEVVLGVQRLGICFG